MRNVCTAWALPEAGVWYMTGRQLIEVSSRLSDAEKAKEWRTWLKDNPVTYGLKPLKPVSMPAELGARFEPDYVAAPVAESLLHLLEKVQRQEVFDGGELEHTRSDSQRLRCHALA